MRSRLSGLRTRYLDTGLDGSVWRRPSPSAWSRGSVRGRPELSLGVQHGIGVTKGCSSPTRVGDPYGCTYTVLNCWTRRRTR